MRINVRGFVIRAATAITELNGAFGNCKALTSITIPSGVKNIGNATFSGCENPESVTIPASVTRLGRVVFFGCKKLTSINYGGTEQQWNSVTKGDHWDDGATGYTVHYGNGNAQ